VIHQYKGGIDKKLFEFFTSCVKMTKSFLLNRASPRGLQEHGGGKGGSALPPQVNFPRISKIFLINKTNSNLLRCIIAKIILYFILYKSHNEA
jgi:hypothetical protein